MVQDGSIEAQHGSQGGSKWFGMAHVGSQDGSRWLQDDPRWLPDGKICFNGWAVKMIQVSKAVILDILRAWDPGQEV